MSRLPDSSGNGPRDKLRVLVVDDEPTLRLGFAYALEGDAITADTAANGREALAKIGARRYDLVILDLRMPEIDGITVIERLRETGNDVPVVLCSAFINLRAALRAIHRQVVDFLIKPVSPRELRQIVWEVLRPGDDLLARALSAAREGRREDAIRILEEGNFREKDAEAIWLKLFHHLDHHPPNDPPPIEERFISESLERIAFHATPQRS